MTKAQGIAEDSSGNGNHGALTNGAKWDDGRFGKAVSLDGVDDYVEIPDAPNLSGMEEITVALWVFVRSFNGGGYNGFVDKTRGGTAGWRSYNIAQRNGQWEWGLANEANTKNALNAGTTLENEWVHLAGTYDGKAMKLFENAVEIGAIPQDGPVQDSDSFLAFGAWPGGGISNFADILIDEIVIFDVVLTAADLKAVMENGLEQELAIEPTGKLPLTWGRIKVR